MNRNKAPRPRRLQLKKERIRVLSAPQLADAMGGASNQSIGGTGVPTSPTTNHNK